MDQTRMDIFQIRELTLLGVTSRFREITVDESLRLVVDVLDPFSDNVNVSLKETVLLKEILHSHQVLTIIL